MKSRSEVVKLATSWIGKNEADGSYREIIDIYNSYSGPFPRSTKMQYGWAWCAATWSALAIKLGYTDIMPIEISCPYLIERAKQMGCWQENDGYLPKPGDAVLYDWQDDGVGDNFGTADHVGIVDYVNSDSGYFTVIEGNKSKAVGKRTVSVNGRYIRGFITPRYDDSAWPVPVPPSQVQKKDLTTIAREVIIGQWGNGDNRRRSLEANGYNYDEVQAKVNELLTGKSEKPTVQSPQSNAQPVHRRVMASCAAQKYNHSISGTYKVTAKDGLYLRNDAGTNKRALCLIPSGQRVENYGYYTIFGGVKWLYIQFVLNGVQYTGFSSEQYLQKQ